MYDDEFQKRVARHSRAEDLACDLLEVEPGASDAELKSAWRRQCKRYHPDRRPDDAGATARFKLVQRAYRCLRNGENCEDIVDAYEQIQGKTGEKTNHWKYFLSWRDQFF